MCYLFEKEKIETFFSDVSSKKQRYPIKKKKKKHKDPLLVFCFLIRLLVQVPEELLFVWGYTYLLIILEIAPHLE